MSQSVCVLHAQWQCSKSSKVHLGSQHLQKTCLMKLALDGFGLFSHVGCYVKGKTSSVLDAHRNHLPQSTDVVGIDPFVGDLLNGFLYFISGFLFDSLLIDSLC